MRTDCNNDPVFDGRRRSLLQVVRDLQYERGYVLGNVTLVAVVPDFVPPVERCIASGRT
jgi:hypothetical protein